MFEKLLVLSPWMVLTMVYAWAGRSRLIAGDVVSAVGLAALVVDLTLLMLAVWWGGCAAVRASRPARWVRRAVVPGGGVVFLLADVHAVVTALVVLALAAPLWAPWPASWSAYWSRLLHLRGRRARNGRRPGLRSPVSMTGRHRTRC